MSNLQGKRAFITGSMQGIGFGIAQTFAAEGCRIVLHGIADEAQIAEAKAQILAAGAPDVTAYTADLRDPEATEAMVADILRDGPVDILVNNAGIQFVAPISEMPRSKWNDIIAVNLSSAFDTMRLLLPQMAERGYGRVINIASVHGLVASVEKAPYVSAKHGIVGLTKVAALEYAAKGNPSLGGVTVNAICPGWVETPLIEPQIMARAAKYGNDRDAGVTDLVSEKQPSGRLAAPTDIGALATWLCDTRAHNITGASIPIDGGWSAQ